jgi:hypothetical protein
MSIELKNVTYTYSPGTAYEIHALKDINLYSGRTVYRKLSDIQEVENLH